MAFCPDCGSPLPGGAESCPSCGSLQAPGPGSLVWSARMPVVTSPVVVKQLVFALGAGALFVALLMVAMGAYAALPWVAGGVAGPEQPAARAAASTRARARRHVENFMKSDRSSNLY